jgi:hypothetical protein
VRREGLLDLRAFRESDNVIFACRSAIALLIGFAVGYLGYRKPTYNTIAHFNAWIPCAVALLMSKGMFSAQRSFVRAGGLLGGTMLGLLTYGLLGSCSWWSFLVLSFYVLGLAWLGLLLSFGPGVCGGASGLFLVWSGVAVLSRGCADTNDHDPHPRASYHLIISMAIAVLINFLADIIFDWRRASDVASGGYLAFFSELRGAMRELFNSNQETVWFHKHALLDKIEKCTSLGRQAAGEMRWWRNEWPGPLFESACASALQLCACLACVQRAVARHHAPDGAKNPRYADRAPKAEFFQRLLQEPEIQELATVVEQAMGQFELVLEVFSHEMPWPPRALIEGSTVLKECRERALRAITAFFIKSSAPSGLGLSWSSEQQAAISLFVSSVFGMLEEMRRLDQAIREKMV